MSSQGRFIITMASAATGRDLSDTAKAPVPPPFVVPMTRTRCLARREGTEVESCSSRARDADFLQSQRPTFLELKMLAATGKEASVREQEPQH